MAPRCHTSTIVGSVAAVAIVAIVALVFFAAHGMPWLAHLHPHEHNHELQGIPMSATSPNMAMGSAIGKYNVIGAWPVVAAAINNRAIGDTALVTGFDYPVEMIWDGTKWATAGFVDLVRLPATLSASTTSETAVINAQLPAGLAIAGSIIEVELSGVKNNTTSASTTTTRMRFGNAPGITGVIGAQHTRNNGSVALTNSNSFAWGRVVFQTATTVRGSITEDFQGSSTLAASGLAAASTVPAGTLWMSFTAVNSRAGTGRIYTGGVVRFAR